MKNLGTKQFTRRVTSRTRDMKTKLFCVLE